MAAVTFTRKAAAELRGRFQLTLERALARRSPTRPGGSALGRPCATSSGSSPGPSTRSAPTCSASGRWRPAWRRASPSWTRSPRTTSARRAWRDYLDRAARRRLAGPAGAARGRRDGRATSTALRRRSATTPRSRSPPGEAPRPDPAPARAALESVLDSSSPPCCPGRSTATATCKVQRAHARASRGALRVAIARRAARASPSCVAEWRERARRRAEVVAGRRHRRTAKETSRGALRRVPRGRRALPRSLAPVRLPPRADPAARGPRVRRRRRGGARVTLNYGDLLQYAATLLRDNLRGARGAPAEVPLALRGRVPGHRPDPGRGDPAAGARRRARSGTGRACPCGPARCSWWAIRSSPSIGSAGRTSTSTSACGSASRTTGGQVATLTACFRSVPALCEWANTAFGELFPVEATPHQPGFAGLQARPQREGRRVRRAHHRRFPRSRRRPTPSRGSTPTRSPASSAPRSTPGRRKPGDFLILTRSRRALPIYTRALEALAPAGRGERRRGLRPVVGGHRTGRSADAPSPIPTTGRRSSACSAARSSASAIPSCSGTGRPASASSSPRPTWPRCRGRSARRCASCARCTTGRAGCPRRPRSSASLKPPASWRGPRPRSPGGAEAGDLLHAVDRIRQVTEEGGTLADAADGADPRTWSPPRSSPCRSSPGAPTWCA